MQFIANGPDIPEALLQAHEEGRVVFFCGAGISYPAGLPGFKGLVEQIFSDCGVDLSGSMLETFNRGQFDVTLDQLERFLAGHRLAMRRALAGALELPPGHQNATDTHAALLRLGRNRDGQLRLVTTNFDRMFHAAAEQSGQAFEAFAAPMLPIPKKSRWNGLVFLHGLLPVRERANASPTDDTALNRLVVTSGDFGLAYLAERWAARFVSELFRDYVVCFVGYSINDPVMRYLMDALAADRALGESSPQAWAFGGFESEREAEKAHGWDDKGVIPILYRVQSCSNDHSALFQTLKFWAETYRDGVQGKEAIVVKHALARPQHSTKEDDFVGRVLWALTDKSGLPAKRFAEFDPTPSLDWLLEVFSVDRFGHSDLTRFCVPVGDILDADLKFSLIQRPAPYDRAPTIKLVLTGNRGCELDKIMTYLAFWLLNHLNDPRLVIWIAQRGGQLHQQWSQMIEQRLTYIEPTERGSNQAGPDALRAKAPNAIPKPLMRTLWRLILSNRVISFNSYPRGHVWMESLKRDKLTTVLRLELRELLSPKIALEAPRRSRENEVSVDEAKILKDVVDWKIVFAAGSISLLLDEAESEPFRSTLPMLLEEIQLSLRDALDLSRELGEAKALSDQSHYGLPSVAPHGQNRRSEKWVSLIELLRDSWLGVRRDDPERAARIAQDWFSIKYPTFKRLALFAASQDDCIRPEQWVNWLLSDDAWWLWSEGTRREVLRLLALQGRHLAGNNQSRLEAAILTGSSQSSAARPVWLRLAKLRASGLVLGELAAARLEALSVEEPDWTLAADERDEFSVWIGSGGGPGSNDNQIIDVAPRERQGLVRWLRRPRSEQRRFESDDWGEVCRSRFALSIRALCDLAEENYWPTRHWSEALRIWARYRKPSRFWRFAGPLVVRMPEAELKEIVPYVTEWKEAVSKSIDRHEDIFLSLCGRVLALEFAESDGSIVDGELASVTRAINHPIGSVALSLVQFWFKREPNDNDGLSDDIKPLFTQICERSRYGRVVLSVHLIALFRVDRVWTERYLLPSFDWGGEAEARAVWEARSVWQGFLWSPRLYQPLLIAFKKQFLMTAEHYLELGQIRKHYPAILTFAALDVTEGYSAEDFRRAIEALPQEGLEHAALALAGALGGSGDQREEFWKNRVKPFWQKCWPKDCERSSPAIAKALARVIIASGGAFGDAFKVLEYWLKVIDDCADHIRELSRLGLSTKFPREALSLICKIFGPSYFVPWELKRCLDEIEQAAPELANEECFRQLRDQLRGYDL